MAVLEVIGAIIGIASAASSVANGIAGILEGNAKREYALKQAKYTDSYLKNIKAKSREIIAGNTFNARAKLDSEYKKNTDTIALQQKLLKAKQTTGIANYDLIISQINTDKAYANGIIAKKQADLYRAKSMLKDTNKNNDVYGLQEQSALSQKSTDTAKINLQKQAIGQATGKTLTDDEKTKLLESEAKRLGRPLTDAEKATAISTAEQGTIKRDYDKEMQKIQAEKAYQETTHTTEEQRAEKEKQEQLAQMDTAKKSVELEKSSAEYQYGKTKEDVAFKQEQAEEILQSKLGQAQDIRGFAQRDRASSEAILQNKLQEIYLQKGETQAQFEYELDLMQRDRKLTSAKAQQQASLQGLKMTGGVISGSAQAVALEMESQKLKAEARRDAQNTFQQSMYDLGIDTLSEEYNQIATDYDKTVKQSDYIVTDAMIQNKESVYASIRELENNEQYKTEYSTKYGISMEELNNSIGQITSTASYKSSKLEAEKELITKQLGLDEATATNLFKDAFAQANNELSSLDISQTEVNDVYTQKMKELSYQKGEELYTVGIEIDKLTSEINYNNTSARNQANQAGIKFQEEQTALRAESDQAVIEKTALDKEYRIGQSEISNQDKESQLQLDAIQKEIDTNYAEANALDPNFVLEQFNGVDVPGYNSNALYKQPSTIYYQNAPSATFTSPTGTTGTFVPEQGVNSGANVTGRTRSTTQTSPQANMLYTSAPQANMGYIPPPGIVSKQDQDITFDPATGQKKRKNPVKGAGEII